MKVLSLFSGAGGMDLGFRRQGHKILWANDFDQDAVASYKKNIGSHIVHGDIRKIASTDLPDTEIVIGGFPCQGFSRANLLRSRDDERNSLYREFLRIVRKKQPRYFVAENVSGILSLNGGLVVKKIVKDFERLGYVVRYSLFNSANFGVPQMRRRVIFIGSHRDLAEDEVPQFPKPTHSANPEQGLRPWVTTQLALAGIPEPDVPNDLVNHVYSKYKVVARDFTGHRLTNPERPSPTILARGNGKGGVCAIPHPNGYRRMSVRECATIQTFPMKFEFVGSLNSMYRQVGNAVPVLFAQHVAAQFNRLGGR